MTLLDQRCFHHDIREAVAQCPSCKLFFCRECVTEHEGRMICRTCVAAAIARIENKTARTARAFWTVTALGGILIAWLVFYYLGLALARVPSKFHAVSEPRPQGAIRA
jgi:hypothetical protein